MTALLFLYLPLFNNLNESNMDNNLINNSIYKALDNYGKPLGTSRMSMFSSDDRYAHPPFLAFRYDNTEKDDPIYAAIQTTINTFNGHLKWVMITKDSSANYMILPELFEKTISSGHFFNKDWHIAELIEGEYEWLIDTAIEDITSLAALIQDNSPVNKELQLYDVLEMV
jgi:hypothetical protein